LHADLSFLASDALQGRLTATNGNQLATEFIRARFERLRLKPVAPDATYYQSYHLMTNTLGSTNEITADVGEKRVSSKLGDDFYPHRFSDSGHVEGGLVFAGFGIVSADGSYDDYRGADLRGQIALVLDHAPGESGSGRTRTSPFDTEAATPLQKTLAAQTHGAAAVLFVIDVHNHPSTGGSLGSETANVWPQGTPRIDRYTLAAWTEAGAAVDASGGLPDGTTFDGAAGLRQALLARPELFVGTAVEKLMTYALGRGLDHRDAAAVRKIIRDAAKQDYRFSSLVLGIVRSVPFQMRMSDGSK
jgi:hypothetical protein